jgi:acyl-CoA synthetase (AMP-forming)/AMP-acid ligase II
VWVGFVSGGGSIGDSDRSGFGDISAWVDLFAGGAVIVGSLAELADATRAGGSLGRITLSATGEALKAELVSEFEKIFRGFDLRHGDRVVLIVEQSLDAVAALIGGWAMGLVMVPLRGHIEDAGCRNIMQHCNARLMIEPTSRQTITSERPETEPERFRFMGHQPVSGSDLALIIYTSGSTGKPKGIALTHNNIISAVNSIAFYLGIKPNDVIICASPLAFDYGLYQVLFALHTGCHTVLLGNQFNPLSCIRAIEAFGVTIVPVVPSMAVAIVRTAEALKADLSSVRLVTNTGGHLSGSTIARIQATLPHVEICAMYGLSESKRALFLPPKDLERKPGSVGRAMPGLAAAVFLQVQRSGETYYEQAPPRVIGELFVRGPSLMQGYVNEEEGGTRIIGGSYRDDNWLATGDLFETDEDGYFYFKGRAKDLIKQDGYCLYPREIEEVVERHPDVELAVVVSVADVWGNEQASLTVLRRDRGCGHHERQEIEAWLAQDLAPEYRPKQLNLAHEIPINGNGKPDRAALRRLNADCREPL